MLLKYRAVFIAVSIILLLMGIMIFGYVFPSTRDLLIERRLQTSREMTKMVLEILQIYQEQVKNGSMTQSQAQEKAMKVIGVIRYGYQENNYFWIIDTKMRLVVHPYLRELKGKVVSDLTDSQHKPFIKDIRRLALKKQSGFVHYYWHYYDDPNRVEEKVAYIHSFKPWNWIVGTGVYLVDDHNEFSRIRWHLIIFAAILVASILALAFYLSLRELRADKRKDSAENALQESEFRFSSFFHSNPEGIILMSFEGKIIDVNKEFECISGYSKQELVGKCITEFIDEDNHVFIHKALNSINAGILQDQPCELTCIKKNKKELPLSIRLWRITAEDSTPVSLGAFVHDLTCEKNLVKEKMELQEQLFQAQKMESIGNLAGGIAHDFNNILGGIVGYTELALIGQPENCSDTQRMYMNRVLEAANRAKDLVFQILKFSRPDQTGMKAISLNSLIAESVNLLSSSLPSTIRINQEIQATQDTMMGDPTQIHQVIMNLATNAFHAMRLTGGVLTISLTKVTITSPMEFLSLRIFPGNYLKLSITDTGSGIDEIHINKIFDPYFTTKRTNEGTGLGLSVTLGIIKGHSGLIEVTSNLELGTRFDLYFPVAQDSQPKLEVPKLPMPKSNGERILIVDDEEFFLDVIRRNLESFGYRVAYYSQSLQALKAFKHEPSAFDLIITDQTMPDMTGIQLITEIRKYNDTIPIILCSGFSEIVNEYNAESHGISKFIMKPTNTYDFVKAVSDVLKN